MRRRQTHSGGRRGFTLVELLVVISLIGILATLVVSVGSAVRGKAAEDQTRAVLKVLDGAIDAYRDALNNRVPAAYVNWRTDPPPNETAQATAARRNTAWLLIQLERINAAQKQIDTISEDLLKEVAPNFDPDGQGPRDCTCILDAFDNPLNYQAAAGAGGTPVVISAGANGIWGDADDLRSDDQ